MLLTAITPVLAALCFWRAGALYRSAFDRQAAVAIRK
jgi:hypothetical protein